jgi:choline-sulfatase
LRRHIVPWAVALLALVPGLSCQRLHIGGRPNILLFTLDTYRADNLGSYGSTQGVTPELDKLAAEGVRFSRTFTVTPLTIPAHSSLFTGMLPPRHGVRDNGDFFLGDGAFTLAEALKGAGYATMASVGAEVTSHHWGFSQGFDSFFDDMGKTGDEGGNRWRVERRGDAVVKDALSWLDTHATGPDPFFAWVHFYDAHSPYQPPEDFAARFPHRPYLGEAAYVDAQVKVILDSLSTHGVLDDTWVFALADHGESLGAHGESMHGVLLYDETTRIPLVIRPPTGHGQVGRVVDEPTSIVDVMPTILSIAGQPPLAGLDGTDLLPVVLGKRGASIPADRALFVESQYAWRHFGWAPQTALVTQEYKLIDSTTPELYKRSDRTESQNLATSDATLLGSLRDRLHAWEAALAPAADVRGRVEQSEERLAQLEALGYMTSSVAEGTVAEEGLPDPVSRLPVLRDVESARRAMQEGNLDEARRLAKAVIEAEPQLKDPRMLLANALWRSGDIDAALAELDKLEEMQPSSGVWSMKGVLWMNKGDLEQALYYFGKAIDADPYLASAWPPYLHALFLRGEFPRLDTEVERARGLLPDSNSILAMQGVVLHMHSEDGDAEPILKTALNANPGLPFLNLALGEIAQARGQDREAEAYYLEETRLFAVSIAARKHLVEIFAGQGRYEEQLAQLRLIAKHEKPDALTAHSAAQALFNLKRYDEALTVVNACCDLAPNYPACAMLKANALKKLGRTKDALDAYHRALKLGEVQGLIKPTEGVSGTEPAVKTP